MPREASINDFGLLIAYIVPGFVALWGAAYLSATVQSWIGWSPTEPPSVGGFLYVTIASIAAGMTASTVRWLLVDTLHHRTGLGPPDLDFSQFEQKTAALGILIDIHYRYYQFYGNMLVSLAFVYLARRSSLGFWSTPLGWADLGFFLLGGVFFLGSRDTLAKYYARSGQLLGTRVLVSRSLVAPVLQPTEELSPRLPRARRGQRR